MQNSLFHGSVVNSNRILYTPSNFARSSLLHLQEIGKLQAQKPHISKRENLDSYLFFMVLSGSGNLHYQGERFPLTAGDCAFINCSTPYSHQSSNQLWDLKWIHFNGTSLPSIYDKYLERGGLPSFHPVDLHDFEQLWEQLFRLAGSSDYIRDMKINSMLAELMVLLMNESWNPGHARNSSSKINNIQEIKQYLEEHYADKITLDELADHFYINKFYLTRIFKSQFGVSINNYLLQIRITHAKQLLRFTSLSMEEIGLQCGMGAPNYFSRMFKQVEGISPREYRRLW